jgi:hypothetical protein
LLRNCNPDEKRKKKERKKEKQSTENKNILEKCIHLQSHTIFLYISQGDIAAKLEVILKLRVEKQTYNPLSGNLL